jgi:hypothetical protein
MACVAASFVVKGGDTWMATDRGVGWTRTVVSTVIVDVAVETPVIETELGMAVLRMADV